MKRIRHATQRSGKPRRSRKAIKRVAKKPSANFKPLPLLGVLWLVTTSSARMSLAGAIMELHNEFDALARELARVGILQQVPVRPPGDSWLNAYELAPLQVPLDQSNSETVRQLTDCMLQHQQDRLVTDLRTVSGLLTKLLGGIRHPDCGSRFEYAAQF